MNSREFAQAIVDMPSLDTFTVSDALAAWARDAAVREGYGDDNALQHSVMLGKLQVFTAAVICDLAAKAAAGRPDGGTLAALIVPPTPPLAQEPRIPHAAVERGEGDTDRADRALDRLMGGLAVFHDQMSETA